MMDIGSKLQTSNNRGDISIGFKIQNIDYMKGEEIIVNLRNAIEQKVVSEQVREIIKRTVLNIPIELIDHTRSICKVKLKEKYVYLNIFSLSDVSIPFEITFSDMIDFYSDEASILEMEEVGNEIEEICSTINIWLGSNIRKVQYKRGDYVGRTDYYGTHKNMSSRRLFTRTTPFGRFGKKVINQYKPWIMI